MLLIRFSHFYQVPKLLNLLKDFINIHLQILYHFLNLKLILIKFFILLNIMPFYFLIKVIFLPFQLSFYITLKYNLFFLLIYFMNLFIILIILNYQFLINKFFKEFKFFHFQDHFLFKILFKLLFQFFQLKLFYLLIHQLILFLSLPNLIILMLIHDVFQQFFLIQLKDHLTYHFLQQIYLIILIKLDHHHNKNQMAYLLLNFPFIKLIYFFQRFIIMLFIMLIQ